MLTNNEAIQRPEDTADTDGERFTGLNIRGFSAIEVFAEIFLRCLGHMHCISTHYLVYLKSGTYIHGKTFTVLLKTVKV